MDASTPVDFDRAGLKQTMGKLAVRGVFLGTYSWKYAGWCGQLYERDRYIWHGRWSDSRFERQCLSEYAETFKTVCVDAAYYKFPDDRYLDDLASQVPADFQFAFKVTDQITIKRFANFPRYGLRAGSVNEDFLNADLFVRQFLGPVQGFQSKIG